MKIINKDILTVESGIIAHQVNCMGVMGAGLALKIKQKYPKVFEYYKNYYNSSKLKLGLVQIIPINSNLNIANLVAQYKYGADKQYTDYHALEQCLVYLYECGIVLSKKIYIPYGIGCGLAGGDWHIVLDLIEKHCPESIICKYEN